MLGESDIATFCPFGMFRACLKTGESINKYMDKPPYGNSRPSGYLPQEPRADFGVNFSAWTVLPQAGNVVRNINDGNIVKTEASSYRTRFCKRKCENIEIVNKLFAY